MLRIARQFDANAFQNSSGHFAKTVGKRGTFTVQPPMAFGSYQVHIAQLASFEPVQPVAKLTITPADFPFLTQIRGHDDKRLQEYATALQTGASWPSDL